MKNANKNFILSGLIDIKLKCSKTFRKKSASYLQHGTGKQ